MNLVIPTQPLTISPPTGASNLPLVEIKRSKVTKDRVSVRLRKGSEKLTAADCSYGNFDNPSLSFSAWQFFHAAKKTELACSFSEDAANRRAFAFALEHEDTFIWNSTNFRKIDRAVFSLEDFSESGLAGRVGEAFAYLTMLQRGYVYWDRCATVWERAARNANITHSEQLKVVKYISSKVSSGKPKNEPDFIFEKENGEVALMEAKGGFVNPGDDYPRTKDVLKQALKQLDAWSSVILPTPIKSYGICTLLREENDTHKDPSLIAYVDPPGRKSPNLQPAELPLDLVRRCHFGAWLSGMGFTASGNALRDLQKKKLEEVILPIKQIGDRQFAFKIIGWKLPDEQSSLILDPWYWDVFPYHWMRRGDCSALVIGIEEQILHMISKAIQNPQKSILLDIDTEKNELIGQPTGKFSGSVMPDGTMIGTINITELEKSMMSREHFKL